MFSSIRASTRSTSRTPSPVNTRLYRPVARGNGSRSAPSQRVSPPRQQGQSTPTRGYGWRHVAAEQQRRQEQEPHRQSGGWQHIDAELPRPPTRRSWFVEVDYESDDQGEPHGSSDNKPPPYEVVSTSNDRSRGEPVDSQRPPTPEPTVKPSHTHNGAIDSNVGDSLLVERTGNSNNNQ